MRNYYFLNTISLANSKINIVILLLFFFNQDIFSQLKNEEQIYKNAIYYEVLGHTRSLVSINYERSFYKINDILYLNARTGIAFETTSNSDGVKSDRLTTVPSVLLLQIGKRTHFINFGYGYSVTFSKHLIDDSSYPRFDSAHSISLGYKFVYDNLFVQVYPVRIFPKNFEAKNSAGISFGFTW